MSSSVCVLCRCMCACVVHACVWTWCVCVCVCMCVYVCGAHMFVGLMRVWVCVCVFMLMIVYAYSCVPESTIFQESLQMYQWKQLSWGLTARNTEVTANCQELLPTCGVAISHQTLWRLGSDIKWNSVGQKINETDTWSRVFKNHCEGCSQNRCQG